jgi:hypothetical protein
MADTAISSMGGNGIVRSIWVNKDEGFVFYTDATTLKIVYRRSTNGGATWGAETDIFDVGTSGIIWDCWYDQWTRGLGNNEVWFIVAVPDSPEPGVLFVRFDVGLQITTPPIVDIGPLRSFSHVSITMNRSGDICGWAYQVIPVPRQWTFISTDGGASFPEVADPEDTGDAPLVLMPGQASSHFFAIHPDTSTGRLRMDQWVPAQAAWQVGTPFSVAGWSGSALMAAVYRHSDDHNILVASQAGGLGQIETWDMEDRTTFVQRANLQGVSRARSLGLMIEQDASRLIGLYADRNTGGIRYRISRNGAVSWLQLRRYNSLPDDPFDLTVHAGGSLRTIGGRVTPVWFRDSNNTLVYNPTNAFDACPWGTHRIDVNEQGVNCISGVGDVQEFLPGQGGSPPPDPG